jgi:hypothetical protein
MIWSLDMKAQLWHLLALAVRKRERERERERERDYKTMEFLFGLTF